MTDSGAQLIDFDAYVKDLAEDSDPAHEADVLLLTCMDFRFFLEIAERMKGIKYDHVILAGAALGAVVKAKEETWQPTFFDHLGLAKKLHHIKSVLVMEHRECGAYGPAPGFGLLDPKPERERERVVHEEQVAKLEALIPDDLGFCALLLEVPPHINALTFDKLK